jgi:hypothetical protein
MPWNRKEDLRWHLITSLSARVGHVILLIAMLQETPRVAFDLTQLSPGKKVPVFILIKFCISHDQCLPRKDS